MKAESIAGELDHCTIIHGSAAEADILTECGIEATDVFIAASNDDDSNLISSVLAKKMGVKTTIIITQQADYLTIVDALDINAIITPYLLAVEQILHIVRGKGISSVTKFAESDAEVLEFIPEAGAPVTKDIIKNIKFPKDSIVGAVCHNSQAKLADGKTQILEGEKVIVFCQKDSVKKLQKLFTC